MAHEEEEISAATTTYGSVAGMLDEREVGR